MDLDEINRLLAQGAQYQRLRSNQFEENWVLRQNETGRLVFKAKLLHNNEKNADASVHGTLFYEKKKVKYGWEPVEAIALSSLKGGEGVKLDLKAQEVLDLYQHLHRKLGKPSKLQALLESVEDLSEGDEAAVGDLVAWALKSPTGAASLVTKLKTLDTSALSNLNAAVQLASLEDLQRAMYDNFQNAQEKYWQELLSTRPVLLQQLFEFPVTIAEESAYVGGKLFSNQGGQLVDFLVKNKLTNNVSLVEIKTPHGPLLQATPYRANVYGCSAELGGAVAQVLAYKESLLKNFYPLSQQSENQYEAFDPRCIVILGHTRELDSQPKRRCFELFRAQLPTVKIVTFDELYEQLSSLINLFKGV